MSTSDFAIQARVQRLLARHWIRTDCLEVGTTQGVVVLKGRLEYLLGGSLGAECVAEQASQALRAAIRRLPGVVDVAMQVREPQKTEPPCTGTAS
ncbi:MAG: hypothetical protein GF330_14000 [Candidatus Eisenbacteria bacterium]|nr:hypothetical protein [Candidatus Eisenbacteria bacterium]